MLCGFKRGRRVDRREGQEKGARGLSAFESPSEDGEPARAGRPRPALRSGPRRAGEGPLRALQALAGGQGGGGGADGGDPGVAGGERGAHGESQSGGGEGEGDGDSQSGDGGCGGN